MPDIYYVDISIQNKPSRQCMLAQTVVCTQRETKNGVENSIRYRKN